MTNSEAIETLKANYPDPCFGLLREAVDTAIYELSAQPEIIHCRECQHWKQGELVDKCGLLDCYADADCYCAWAVRERRRE